MRDFLTTQLSISESSHAEIHVHLDGWPISQILPAQKPDERLDLQELYVTANDSDANFWPTRCAKCNHPRTSEDSEQTNPESLLHPAITRKHANPAGFFSLFFFSHSLFWYAQTRTRKPAKCLIHDSNATIRKLTKGTFVYMGQVKCKLCDKPKCVQTG